MHDRTLIGFFDEMSKIAEEEDKKGRTAKMLGMLIGGTGGGVAGQYLGAHMGGRYGGWPGAVAGQAAGGMLGAGLGGGLGYGAGGLVSRLTKTGQDEYSVVPGSWMAGQRAAARLGSGRTAQEGAGLLADPELIGERTRGALKGMAVGGGIGLGAGALAGGAAHFLSRGRIPLSTGLGVGALGGGALGALTGDIAGMSAADKAFYAKRGLKQTWGGLGRGRLTPEAAEKYLTAKELAEATRE